MFSQNQIRDFKIADPVVAATVGRPNEVAFIASLNNHFSFVTNGALVADGTTIIPANGLNNFWVLIGTATIKDNVAAVIAPSATDDSSLGYSVGSRWIDTVLDKAYVCLDSTATAAIWQATTIQPYPRVANYAALPLATVPSAGTVYFVETGTGTFGVARKPAGLWVTNGIVWNYAGTAIDSVSDVNFTIYSGLDSTRTIKHSASAITPGTQRTIIMPDADVKLHKDNLVGTVAPTVAAGTVFGYDVGSIWIDVILGDVYQCVDATVAAAVWKKLNSAAGILDNLTAIVGATVTDDSTLGYSVGSHWVDTTLGVVYVCVDATATAAVWKQVSNPNEELNNYAATTNPSTTDDVTLGYTVGSGWVNNLFNTSWKCVDSTATAAIWKQTSNYNLTTNNFAAIVPPTINNDAIQSYDIGSVWVDTVTDKSYICLDPTTAAAVWKETTPAAQVLNNLVAVIAPATTDDSAAGYAIGSVWVDTLTDKSYICLDSTATAAVWKETTSNASILNNYAGTLAPTTADDNVAGYSIGSHWIDTVANKGYICANAATGAATWNTITYIDAPFNYAGMAPPSSTDDITAGYTIGSKWLDTVAENMYVCVNHDAVAAVWHQIDQTITAGVATPLDYFFHGRRSVSITSFFNPGLGPNTVNFGNLVPTTYRYNFAGAAHTSGTAGISSAGSVLTVTSAGRYRFQWDATSVADVFGAESWAQLVLNGTTVVAVGGTDVVNTAAPQSYSLHWEGMMAAGDTLDIRLGTSGPGNRLYSAINCSISQQPSETVVPAGSAKANFIAIVAPAITDSTDNGYAIGSQWVDTVANTSYICVDAAAGAAVWKETTPSSLGVVLNNYAATAAPTNTDDATLGYLAGSQWVDKTNDISYICVSALATSAIWNRTNYADALHNYTATVAPQATDSISLGYTVGSKWLDTLTENMYICVNHAAGLAVWHQIDVGASLPKYSSCITTGLGSSAAIMQGLKVRMNVASADAVVYDPSGMSAAASLVIASAGDYSVTYGYSSSTTTDNTVRMLLNGAPAIINRQRTAVVSGNTTRILALTVGDILEFDTLASSPIVYSWNCAVVKID